MTDEYPTSTTTNPVIIFYIKSTDSYENYPVIQTIVKIKSNDKTDKIYLARLLSSFKTS